MEMVDIVATSNFINSEIGSISRKDRLRVSKELAQQLINLRIAKLNPLATVCRNKPTLTVPPVNGGGELSALLPADQASPRKIAILLQAAPVGSASQSMTVSKDYLVQPSSTLVTAHGGGSITKQYKKNSPGKNGHKTIKRQSNLD